MNNDHMTDKEFIEDMQSLNEEHEPDGYPCVQTKDINRLLSIIADLQSERLLKDKYYLQKEDTNK